METGTQKKAFKQFLIKLSLFGLIIFLLDFAVGAGLKKLYFKAKEGKFYDQTYAFESTKADLLIIGSSKASHHYVSQEIEDKLQISTYNAGGEGAHFLHQCALLKSIFKRYHPKVIIWDYYSGLKNDPVTYFELSAILPYYENHDEIRSIVNLRSPFEKYKLISKIYPYNSTIIYSVNRAINFYKNPSKGKAIKGFIPLSKTWEQEIVKYRRKELKPLDSNCIAEYKSIIQYCKSNNIQLYMVNSPLYRYFINKPNYDIVAQEIADKENVLFLDYSMDTTFINNNQYFSDPIHLNVKGARVFTNKLISEIKKRQTIAALPDYKNSSAYN